MEEPMRFEIIQKVKTPGLIIITHFLMSLSGSFRFIAEMEWLFLLNRLIERGRAMELRFLMTISYLPSVIFSVFLIIIGTLSTYFQPILYPATIHRIHIVLCFVLAFLCLFPPIRRWFNQKDLIALATVLILGPPATIGSAFLLLQIFDGWI